jgi:hypothetical protein
MKHAFLQPSLLLLADPEAKNSTVLTLTHLREALELSKKSLAGYLDTKRFSFGRFNFISDQILLEILGQGSNIEALQRNLRTIFPGIRRFTLDDTQNTLLVGFQTASANNDLVSFQTLPYVQGKSVLLNPAKFCLHFDDCTLIESWMASFSACCKNILRALILSGMEQSSAISSLDKAQGGWEDQNLNLLRMEMQDIQSLSLSIITDYPTQVSLLWHHYLWTETFEKEFRANSNQTRNIGGIQHASRQSSNILKGLIRIVGDQDVPHHFRKRVETLITVQVHYRDAGDSLLKQKVVQSSDFEWQRQARMYWRSGVLPLDTRGEIDVAALAGRANGGYLQVSNVIIEYGFECSIGLDRLAITPLTERCFVSIAQALNLQKGCAISGPAGTGKSETIKELGNLAGKHVVVFNCSEQFTSDYLAKVLRGVTHCGSWGCFDEFNRITLPVLSVAAEQLSCIFRALQRCMLSTAALSLCQDKNMRENQFVFTDGLPCTLNTNLGIMVTMNPASADGMGGYGARQTFPENLKSQFRNFSMFQPDSRIILKVKLFALGFHHAPLISTRIDALYNMCSMQLSKQTHYDFGLRNIISLLRNLTIENDKFGMSFDNDDFVIDDRHKPSGHGTEEELQRCFSAVKRVVSPMLTSADQIFFVQIMQDVNPELKLVAPTAAGSRWGSTVQEMCGQSNAHRGRLSSLHQIPDSSMLDQGGQEAGESDATVSFRHSKGSIVASSEWSQRVVQLTQILQCRWGTMMIGPSNSGKSTAALVVREASEANSMKINPRSLTLNQLFGYYDRATASWVDGVLAKIWTKAAVLEAEHDKGSWIIFDGPVDYGWIENMNSVLDDNKLLTLANGDRMQLSEKMRIIVETSMLTHASPATVSRCGIVHFDNDCLDWVAIVQGWISSKSHPGGFDGNIGMYLMQLFAIYFDHAFEFLEHLDRSDPRSTRSRHPFGHTNANYYRPKNAVVRSVLSYLWQSLNTCATKNGRFLLSETMEDGAKRKSLAGNSGPMQSFQLSFGKVDCVESNLATETAEAVGGSIQFFRSSSGSVLYRCFMHALAWGMFGHKDSISRTQFSDMLQKERTVPLRSLAAIFSDQARIGEEHPLKTLGNAIVVWPTGLRLPPLELVLLTDNHIPARWEFDSDTEFGLAKQAFDAAHMRSTGAEQSPSSAQLVSLFDCCLQADGWVKWADHIQKVATTEEMLSPMNLNSLILPTASFESILHHVSTQWKYKGSPVLVTSQNGAGKTALAQCMRARFVKEDQLVLLNMGFHFGSKPSHLWDKLRQNTERRIGKVYGAVGGKRMLLVIDDVHQPMPNKWSGHPTSEAIRQVRSRNIPFLFSRTFYMI